MTESTKNTIENESGFKALFHYASFGIIVTGSDGIIQLVNPSAERLFGYAKSELIGQLIEILIPDHFHDQHVHHREKYFEKPKARPMGIGMELFARKKNGTVFPVEISLGYYHLAGEKMAMAFVTDITKRQAAELELKKINEELEDRIRERTLELTEALNSEKELNEMKSRFVSIASHEFRTPLSAILSSISLVDRYTETGLEEKRKKHIERIKSSVKNLTDILNDFLSLDKLEQGKVDVERTRFNLPEFCEDIAEEVKGMLKQGQQIHYTHKGEPEIILDKKILRIVMLNLLSNATKYSEENKEIQLLTVSGKKITSVTIIDKGIGIPEEEQKNLFGKFFRAKNALNIQGTGLGLNILKRYVELMNGTIHFTSKLNEGTTFTVDFPQPEK
jgi:PAS domain S-box-containing protein